MLDRATCLRDTDALVNHLRMVLTPPARLDDGAALAARPAAVLIPLHADASGAPHILFTERASTLQRHSGEISFPGGKHDPEDASLQATALREAGEEIGLVPERVTVLGELAPVFTVVSNYLITPFLGLVRGELQDIAPTISAAEVARLIDAPLAALAEPTIAHTEEWLRQGLPHTVYFFQFGQHRIWGATARILAELLALLPPL